MAASVEEHPVADGVEEQPHAAWRSANRFGWLLGGRIWNGPYVLGVVLCVVAGLVLGFSALVAAFGKNAGLSTTLFLLAVLASLVLPIPLHVKRLHDVGLSGWWVPAAYATTVGLVAGAGTIGSDLPYLEYWGLWLPTAPVLGGMVLGALWPGSREANRYGPPPSIYARWNVVRASGIVLLPVGCLGGIVLLYALAVWLS